MKRLGFMQGRLSPQVGGRIQAFPRDHWREEFDAAPRIGFTLMEWTLDDEGLHENPLLLATGRAEIASLSQASGVEVGSLTGDFLMQAPPFAGNDDEKRLRVTNLRAVIDACGALQIRTLVWPLVDDGRIGRDADEDEVLRIVDSVASLLRAHRIRVAFESDYVPERLARFIGRFDHALAGVNYDSGNSAALGYDPDEELDAYGDRVINVHIKDRLRNGGTVPLGTGAADFRTVARGLARARYHGDYVLQVARAADGDHGGLLTRARDFVAPLFQL